MKMCSMTVAVSFAIISLAGCSKEESKNSSAVSNSPQMSPKVEVVAAPEVSKVSIDCGLQNKIFGAPLEGVTPGFPKRYQVVTYSIPSTLLKSNFGDRTSEYTIPSQVTILTSTGKIFKTGLIAVKVEDGIHSVHETVDPENFPPMIKNKFVPQIQIYYDTLEEYNESKNNTIESCFMLK